MLLWFQSFLFRLLNRAATSLLPHQLEPDRQWEVEGRWNSTSGALFFPWQWRQPDCSCHTFALCLCPITGFSLNVYQSLRLEWCLYTPSLSGLLNQGCEPPLHGYSVSWSCGELLTESVAVFSVVPSILLLQLAPVCSPSDISMCECLRYICVLSRKSFVKL